MLYSTNMSMPFKGILTTTTNYSGAATGSVLKTPVLESLFNKVY